MRTFLLIFSVCFFVNIFAQETESLGNVKQWGIVIGGREGIKAFFVTIDKGAVSPLSYFQINSDLKSFYTGADRLKTTVCTISNTQGSFDILINRSSYGSSIILTNGKKCLRLEEIPEGRNVSEASMVLIGEVSDDKSKEIFNQSKLYFENKKDSKVNYNDLSAILIKYLTFSGAEIGNKEMVDPYKWEISVGNKDEIKVVTPQQPP